MSQRADAVEAAVREHPEKGAGVYLTPYGEVRIATMVVTEGCVEVFLAGDTEGGDPHFRIFNPPTIVIGPDGRREDPLQAIAEVIGSNGGAARAEKGRPRR